MRKNQWQYTRRSSAMRGMSRRIAELYNSGIQVDIYNPSIWRNTLTGKFTFSLTQTGYEAHQNSPIFVLWK